MFDVENVPAELLLLMGSRLCLGGEGLAAAGATFINQMMLRNPGNSGAIITLLEARISSTSAQSFVWGPTLNTLATAEPTAFADTRIFGEGTVGQVLSEALLVPGPSFGAAVKENSTEVVLNTSRGLAVLGPGTAFSVSCLNANTTLFATFVWIERVAQPSELQL